MEAPAFLPPLLRLSTHFPAASQKPDSLIATGSKTHSGKDDALCRIIPKTRRCCRMAFGLAALPSHSFRRHARYLQGVISTLPSPLLTHSVGSSVSIHPPSPTWTTRIAWRPAWRLQPLCPPFLLLLLLSRSENLLCRGS